MRGSGGSGSRKARILSRRASQFALAVLSAALFSAATLATPSVKTSADSPAVSARFAQDETGLTAAINAQRAADGLPPLVSDPALTQIARERSADQVTRHYFAHTAPDGGTVFDLLNAADPSWVYGGENLAESRGVDAVSAAINGFMQSPEHRDNVLSPNYARVGVGAAQTDDSTTILTVVFTN